MHRPLIFLMLLFVLPAWAQEADDVDPEAKPEESTEAPEEVIDDEFADELYTEEEDAFIPSENVKFGQSIPFPTDI
ncbi:MAG: hypothetical protein WBM80_13290 [Woeseiaceae bacterium]